MAKNKVFAEVIPHTDSPRRFLRECVVLLPKYCHRVSFSPPALVPGHTDPIPTLPGMLSDQRMQTRGMFVTGRPSGWGNDLSLPPPLTRDDSWSSAAYEGHCTHRSDLTVLLGRLQGTVHAVP